MGSSESKQSFGSNIWIVILALFCALILGYGLLYSNNTTANLIYLVRFNLPLALIVWGVFYALVLRKRSARIAMFSLMVIFISMVASDFLGYVQQKKEAKKALSEIQARYSEYVESSTYENGVQKRAEVSLDVAPVARGEFGELERFSKQFIGQMASLQNDYLIELEVIGWNGILDFNRIENDETLAESGAIIQKAKEVVGRYTRRSKELLDFAKRDIGLLNISEYSKNIVLSGFERGLNKTNEYRNSMWLLEAEIIGEVENIIALLSEDREAWSVDDGNIVFFNETDLQKYNLCVDSIYRIDQEQERILRQIDQMANQYFDQEVDMQ